MTTEKITKRMDELEREGIFIKTGIDILFDNEYQIPVIMEDFDELYREHHDVTQ